jgi:CheY-like chemotaxis protein
MQKNEEGKIDPLQNPEVAMLTELYADVAHEVRNLMQAISGTIELEREATADWSTRNRFTKALANCNLVGNLLTGLLKVMEDHQGHAADAVDIIDDLVDLYRQNTKNRIPIVWQGSRLVQLSVHPLYLRLVLMNVIKNAVEATSQSEHPLVRIRTIERSDRVEIEIWNSGPQIKVEDMEAVFVRSFSTKQESGGAGIGLAVARRLLRDADGDLRVQNTGDGVAFTVSLMKGTSKPSIPSPIPLIAAVSVKRLKGRKVLVIDDDTSVREVLQLMIVELGGGNAELCASGKDAITQLELARDYDAILLDLRMKGLSGQEVFQKLPGSLQSRVIFISGDINNSENARFLKEVRRPSLIKPLNARTLFDAIDSMDSLRQYPAGA